MWLLFNRSHDYLGEMMCQSGAMRSVVLSAKGESEIGSVVALWQTHGLPVKRMVTVQHVHAPDDRAFYVERVQPRDQRFCEAFQAWAGEQGILFIELPEDRLWYWECLLRVPISSVERFLYALGVSQSDSPTLQGLKQLFQDAQTDPNLKQSVRRTRALHQLKLKLAHQMKEKLLKSEA